MPGNLSHNPAVLYHASLERITAARRALDDSAFVEAMYWSGVSVECILQAVALRGTKSHDAAHDLPKWLAKCPSSLQDVIKTSTITEWSKVVIMWDNHLRYLSFDGLLGYLRAKRLTHGVSGDAKSVVRWNARQLVDAAAVVHARGVAHWLSYAKR
ncbi:MAG TPA: hypothetical protein VER17_02155 [Tepidisphaeraceae bacterium]|nr:hypothetical protein [Tepidisphaeraceae bacterium]